MNLGWVRSLSSVLSDPFTIGKVPPGLCVLLVSFAEEVRYASFCLLVMGKKCRPCEPQCANNRHKILSTLSGKFLTNRWSATIPSSMYLFILDIDPDLRNWSLL